MLRNRTVRSLVISTIAKYAEFDRFTSKLGFVAMPRSDYKRMIEAVDGW